jgi:hypothetical protein
VHLEFTSHDWTTGKEHKKLQNLRQNIMTHPLITLIKKKSSFFSDIFIHTVKNTHVSVRMPVHEMHKREKILKI